MVSRSHGFSLLETMLVLALAMLLLLTAVPLGRGWMANTRTALAESQLLQAYARTRALALRNPDAVRGSATAASLRIAADGTLQVLRASGAVSWRAAPGTGVTLYLASSAAANLAGCGNTLTLDNSGLATSACTFYIAQAAGGQRVSAALR